MRVWFVRELVARDMGRLHFRPQPSSDVNILTRSSTRSQWSLTLSLRRASQTLIRPAQVPALVLPLLPPVPPTHSHSGSFANFKVSIPS